MSAPTLVIETSTPQASLALVFPDGRIEERIFQSDRNHNAALFGPLQDLLAGGSQTLERVLVGSGPGSYSGTRVGIAAAQGVAIAMSCPAIAVPSLLATPAAASGTPCLALGDARRGSYWTAGIHRQQLDQEPVLGDADALGCAVAAAVERLETVFAFEEPARFPLPAAHRDSIRVEFPAARFLWQAWLAASEATRNRWTAAAPQPIYLKPPHITAAKRPWFAKD